MTNEIFNHGLIIETDAHAKDWRAGGISGATKIVLREDGNYRNFLPEAEYQSGVYFDTFGCVTFSSLNCLETIVKTKGGSWNKSDRFTAKMSGTTKQGNWMRGVAESVRIDGVVDESVWPYPRKQVDPPYTWDDYYAPIPEDIKQLGLDWLKEYEVAWEWVDLANIRESMKYGPIQVLVRAWPKPGADGLYTDGGSTDRNHAVMLSEATDSHYTIFDHYDKVEKQLVPTYDFKAAIQYFLIKKTDKPMPLITLENDTLVQLVEAPGGFGLYLNGKIIIDDLAKILASFTVRTNGDTKGKVKPLTRAQWDSFEHINLKNETI